MRALILLPAFLLPLSAAAGDLTSRFELSLERVLRGGPPRYTPEFVLADAVPRHQRRFTEFSGDVSGRYIEALSVAAAHTGQVPPVLDEVVSGALALQKGDGHWGDAFSTASITNRDMAILWGNGRMLAGLMANHALTSRPEVLASAVRLGDFFHSVAPRLNNDAVQKEFSDSRIAVGYICWTQIVEGLVELARVTGDTKYRTLSEEIAARTQRYPAQHSHGFVTTLRGILDLHRLTGDPKHLLQVEREWQGIIDSGNLLPHGALPEAFKPLIDRDEGCSEADWLRLNLALWQQTGNARYLEHAELTLFNEFFFNQFSSGDFGHHVLKETGIAPPAARAWWCCTFHGLRAFPDVFRSAFRADGDSLLYGIPVDGVGETPGLSARAASRLEQDGSVTLEIVRAEHGSRTIAVRLPTWAKDVQLRLGDTALSATKGAGSLRVSRQWTPGERVTVRYDLRTRVSRDEKKRITFFCGPWMLAADDDLSPRFFDEPSHQNRIGPGFPASGKDVSLKPARPDSSSPFSVPVARRFLPFAPGGYPMQPQEVLLRPLAEKTGCDDRTRWEFLFTERAGK